jgi:hypothetical protein
VTKICLVEAEKSPVVKFLYTVAAKNWFIAVEKPLLLAEKCFVVAKLSFIQGLKRNHKDKKSTKSR